MSIEYFRRMIKQSDYVTETSYRCVNFFCFAIDIHIYAH